MEKKDSIFGETIKSLFNGMDGFMSTKSVVGEPIHVGDAIILPLVDVSFGVGAGAFTDDKKNNGGGGLGGRLEPSAVIIIHNGTTKLVNIKNQDAITKVLDLVPDVVNKFSGIVSGKADDDILKDVDIDAAVNPQDAEEEQ